MRKYGIALLLKKAFRTLPQNIYIYSLLNQDFRSRQSLVYWVLYAIPWKYRVLRTLSVPTKALGTVINCLINSAKFEGWFGSYDYEDISCLLSFWHRPETSESLRRKILTESNCSILVTNLSTSYVTPAYPQLGILLKRVTWHDGLAVMIV